MNLATKLAAKFEKVYISEESWESRVAERFRAVFPNEKIFKVDDHPYANHKGTLSSEEFDQSKKEIFLTHFKGSFFKRCPGAKKGLACCNYFVLNLGLQCDMNCSYCYLQSYLNTPVLTFYSNIEDAISEMREMAVEHPEKSYRVGTGETIDSLSLDPITLYSKDLMEFFYDFPQWKLEFKTKSDHVDQFLNFKHQSNIIVSWSINPEMIVSNEEHGTASLKKRLQAARKCVEKGFPIAFHIDPVIWSPDWKENYLGLVDEICEQFSPEQLPYISLGALRYQPEQKLMMRERFGYNSQVLRGEMHPGKDGKLRYDSQLRTQMFQTILDRFKSHSPLWKVFLCMETPENWLNTFSEVPHRIDEMNELFKPLPKIKSLNL